MEYAVAVLAAIIGTFMMINGPIESSHLSNSEWVTRAAVFLTLSVATWNGAELRRIRTKLRDSGHLKQDD